MTIVHQRGLLSLVGGDEEVGVWGQHAIIHSFILSLSTMLAAAKLFLYTRHTTYEIRVQGIRDTSTHTSIFTFSKAARNFLLMLGGP